MISRLKKAKVIQLILTLLAVTTIFGCADHTVSINKLTVEYTSTPLGIDIVCPRFGWQMQTKGHQRGYEQTAYKIIVKNPSGEVVWDTEKVDSNSSLAIKYQGAPLQPSTRYDWTVNVWDQNAMEHAASSWFETGLMNPDDTAWEGAQWIGGGDEDLVLYSQYLFVFKLQYSVAISEGSSKAGFVYGANDKRLMDKYKNHFQIENGPNESYIKLELDISKVKSSGNGLAILNIYRVGYAKEDDADKPFKSFNIKPSIINAANKYEQHDFEINSTFGRIVISLDGDNEFFVKEEGYLPEILPFESGITQNTASINLNPTGLGGDYIPFGMVCDIGFSMEKRQKARFSKVEIQNLRSPNNTLFREKIEGDYDGIFSNDVLTESDSYLLDGEENGVFVVADPSHNSIPMLRTEFKIANKIKSAKMYVTARGVYEIFINGEKVGNDFYNPGLTQYNRTHMYQTYDVTNLIKSGENGLGAMVSEGWWSGPLSYGPIWNHFGDRQSLLAKLTIQYNDGSKETIITNDTDWKYFNDGPIIYSSLNLGEIYDATKEVSIEGWSSSGFDDVGWENVVEVPLEGTTFTGNDNHFDGSVTDIDFDNMKLVGQLGNNAGIFKILTAQSMKEVRPGIYVYDMGQNFVGVPRITFANGTAGDTIMLRVSEMLYPDLEESGDNVGMIMTENYRAAISADMYIMKDGEQVFQPKFTSHGYQYIEITGIDQPLPLESV